MCKCCGLLSGAAIKTMTRVTRVLSFTAYVFIRETEAGRWRLELEQGPRKNAVHWHRVALPTGCCDGGTPSSQVTPAFVKLRDTLTSTTNHISFFPSTLTKQRSLLLIYKVQRICILLYNAQKVDSSLLFSEDITV